MVSATKISYLHCQNKRMTLVAEITKTDPELHRDGGCLLKAFNHIQVLKTMP